jgi:hypothetical protein
VISPSTLRVQSFFLAVLTGIPVIGLSMIYYDPGTFFDKRLTGKVWRAWYETFMFVILL